MSEIKSEKDGQESQKCEPGDIYQIKPEADDVFGGCLMTVTEPKKWGAQGYFMVPGEKGGLAYYRCKYENMLFVGKAAWIFEINLEEKKDDA